MKPTSEAAKAQFTPPSSINSAVDHTRPKVLRPKNLEQLEEMICGQIPYAHYREFSLHGSVFSFGHTMLLSVYAREIRMAFDKFLDQIVHSVTHEGKTFEHIGVLADGSVIDVRRKEVVLRTSDVSYARLFSKSAHEEKHLAGIRSLVRAIDKECEEFLAENSSILGYARDLLRLFREPLALGLDKLKEFGEAQLFFRKFKAQLKMLFGDDEGIADRFFGHKGSVEGISHLSMALLKSKNLLFGFIPTPGTIIGAHMAIVNALVPTTPELPKGAIAPS